ncbi:hypothetical protein BKA56DRAFT_605602, partial [Ilyonectria sp. MPI-CAGE-AT-0026]
RTMVSRNRQTRPSLGGLDQTETKTDQTIPITELSWMQRLKVPETGVLTSNCNSLKVVPVYCN